MLDVRYENYLQDSPIYFQFDDRKLAEKLQNDVSEGNGFDIAKSIEEGKIRPSKKLVETVNSLFKGNEEFILLDEQKVAYEKVVSRFNDQVISLYSKTYYLN